MVAAGALSSTFTPPPPLPAYSVGRIAPPCCAFPPRRINSRMEAQAQDHAKPKEAKLWGGRFEEGVTDAVERFTESVSYDKQLYKHDIMGSKAHASMLAQKGLISASDRDSIIEGLNEI